MLQGGPLFLPAQIDAVTRDTDLVTITIGGNDIRYVGDLSFTAGRRSSSPLGWMLRRIWKGPRTPEQRDYAALQARFAAILQQIRHRASQARIIVVTYPAILPPVGTCEKLNITAPEAAAMRAVGDHLADLTRAVAKAEGAILIDLQTLGADHHACSEAPWVNGWIKAVGTRYHPTILGAQATALAIAAMLDSPDFR